MALNKVAWFSDAALLSARLEGWLPTAAPYARWYLETTAVPGAPLFARLVPLGEFCVAASLRTGVGMGVASAVALAMVLNFQLATSAFSSWAFLRDGTGVPILGALAAVALTREPLPYSLRCRLPVPLRRAIRLH